MAEDYELLELPEAVAMIARQMKRAPELAMAMKAVLEQTGHESVGTWAKAFPQEAKATAYAFGDRHDGLAAQEARIRQVHKGRLGR